MPTKLGDILKNLVMVTIKYGRLKEIHKSDLKQFPNLRYLDLDCNDIEALEEDLFMFNPELTRIWLDDNKIVSIGQKTFENLKNLEDFDLSGNACFSKRIQSDMAENIILIIKACYNATAKILYEMPDLDCQRLENGTNSLESEEEYKKLSLKINQIEKDLNEKKNLQNKLRETFEGSSKAVPRFNDHDTNQKISNEFLSRYFWILVIGLPIIFVFSIINVFLVWTFK